VIVSRGFEVATGDGRSDRQDDPDYISEDGVTYASPRGPGTWISGSPTPVFVPKGSTPLEEDRPDGAIPPFALWAMKYRRHGHLLSRADVEIREQFGTGDHTVYVVDDGRKYCMIGRKVGTSLDGCTYCLVGRISIGAYEQLVDDASLTDDTFAGARELSLCVVFEAEEAVSNVSLVETYASIDEVPNGYLPPGPAIEFTEIPGAAR
jgi:hypothetical protein